MKKSTPQILNVTLGNANTESEVIIDSAAAVQVQPRADNVSVRLAAQGGSAADVTSGTYVTVRAATPYRQDDLSGATLRLYLASGTANAVVEIIYWT